MSNKLISIIAFGIIVLDMIWFAIRVVKQGIKIDIKKEKNFLIKEISIYACAIMILLIIWILGFGTVGNFVLCGCSILSVELANREMLQKS